MLVRFSVSFITVCSVFAAVVSAATDESHSWLGPEFSVLQKVYDDCQDKNDFTGCLKGKALLALTKAVDQVNVSMFYDFPNKNNWLFVD